MVEFLVGLAVVLLAAALASELMERLGQPAVLGELLAGIVLGNLVLVGIGWFEGLKTNQVLELLAQVGVVLLLFEVGLESKMQDLFEVGTSAVLVAHIGVIAPMILGFGVSALFLREESWHVHLFVGATLSATSVGITARVLRDLGKTETREARIILGAAVVDDVLGLIVLAVVSSMVRTMGAENSGSEWGSVAWIVVKAAVFLVGALFLGRKIHVGSLRLAQHFRSPHVTLILAVSYCFALAAVAEELGLSPIVGAFAAGLVLEESDYGFFQERGDPPVSSLVRPIAAIFVPLFFVFMGLRVDLRAFGSGHVLAFAAALTAVAVLGKQVCAVGVVEKHVNRMAVGVGMIPRGEVGLIFAGIGSRLMVAGQPVFDAGSVSAMVAMVMATTVMTPPLLKWVFGRRSKA